MPAPTLDGRLLCASGAAYAITGDMKTLAPDPAGRLQRRCRLSGLAHRLHRRAAIDQRLPGGDDRRRHRAGVPRHDAAGFPQSPSVRDWLGDFQADPIAVTGFPGHVHAGFSGTLSVLAPSITAELPRRQASSPPGQPILITGHSKGGAMAALAAWSVQQTAGTPVRVVTFAAAKPGDAGFRAAYEAAGIDHTRYEYNVDIVPHLPLSDGGFLDLLGRCPVRKLPGIGECSQTCGDSTTSRSPPSATSRAAVRSSTTVRICGRNRITPS